MTEFKAKDGSILKKCPTPIGHAIDSHGHIVNVRCKSWKCPYCSQINKKRLLDRVSNGFESDSWVTGFTLTAPVDTSQKEFIESWHRLHVKLNDVYGHLKFFRMTEFSGASHLYYNKNEKVWNWSIGEMRHYHILTNITIPWHDLLEWWEVATKGKAHRIYIKGYKLKSSAGYLSKYVTKSINNEKFNKKERRYSFSQGDGFVLNKIEQMIRYNFRYPSKGEYTFFLGKPVPTMELTGVKPIIPEDDIIYEDTSWNYACLTTLHCSKDDLELMKSWYPQYRWVIT